MEEVTDWNLVCEHCGTIIEVSETSCYNEAKEIAISKHKCSTHGPHFTWAFPVEKTKSE
ncbi:hypothetical protein KKC65_00040 [Patescibacteria group bacterium]|nr:hypothetical protein [Patescibacteria group bacterium]